MLLLLLLKFEPLSNSILFETLKNCTASGRIIYVSKAGNTIIIQLDEKEKSI
jgi:hypothetical protein